MSRCARRHSDVSCAKTAEPIKMPFGSVESVGPRKHVLDGSTSVWEGAILRGKACPGMSVDTAVSCAKMAEPIKMPFGLWTRVRRGEARGAHWRNLAN